MWGQNNRPIEVREPSKHPIQFVRVLGASRSPARQPKQSTKFYSGAPGWAISKLLDGWSELEAVVVCSWTLDFASVNNKRVKENRLVRQRVKKREKAVDIIKSGLDGEREREKEKVRVCRAVFS